MSPSGIMDAMVGKTSRDFTFILDLIGTTEKIKLASSNNINAKADIAYQQTHFIRVLALVAKAFPDVKVHQISDCAFLHSDNLISILTACTAVFKNMTNFGDRLSQFALRGGGAMGLTEFLETDEFQKETSTMPNFKYSRLIGKGLVEANHLEKKGARGMRLFLTREVFDDLQRFQHPFKIRPSVTRDAIDCYEVNWMSDDHFFKDYLGASFSHGGVKDSLTLWGQSLQGHPELPVIELGNSLLELISWA